MQDKSSARWLLLIHQIPPKPDYFRVKIWRRLRQAGAITIKPSVYVLPYGEQTYEDFGWILKEIVAGGGDANLCEVRFMEGLSDGQIVALFQDARKADYEKLMEQIHALHRDLEQGDSAADGELSPKFKARAARLHKRLEDIEAVDFFSAPQKNIAEKAMTDLVSRLSGERQKSASGKDIKQFRGKTWVTRPNVYVDRVACGWLIRRFIDPEARFKFVGTPRYAPKKNEIRFDMLAAEFTHQGDKCTFETMVAQFGIADEALKLIAEIVHDIDLKDGKFARPEAVGLGVVLAATVRACSADDQRMQRGAEIFDNLYAYFKGRKNR